MNRPKTSAGLLMFRKQESGLEVFLVHPGGPFFKNKDSGAWTIPKGEAAAGEELLTRAKLEFEEEVGIALTGLEPIDLGTVKQKGGKTVHAWAFEGDLPQNFAVVSNTFTLQWPPRSGRTEEFPEIDRAEFFSIEVAKQKINQAQIEFLDRLVAIIKTP